MLAILPAPDNIYHLKWRHISANINIGVFDHVDVENNMGKSDISCRLYHPYIPQVPNF